MFASLLADLARALDAARLPYMVIGGQAVLLHGEPRLTQDVDLTLGAAPDRLPDVLGALAAAGVQPVVDPEPFVAETLVLPCAHAPSGLRVDVIFSHEGYEREAIRRTVAAEIGGATVRFASVEDLLIHKLVAGRARDLDDARGVLVRHPAVDLGYLRRWLREFDAALGLGTEAELDRLLGEAPQPSA